LPLAPILADFNSEVGQCDSLIANAHKNDVGGAPILPSLDRQQITVAAFLNLYVAWETFLERSLVELMIGAPTLSGRVPVKYVFPAGPNAARAFVIGINRYFDYGNQDYFKKIVAMYFENGYPYEPHLSSITSELSDLRTMRHASAHITSTTQTALEGLAQRIFTAPQPGITLYNLLTRNDPRSLTAETVFFTAKTTLVVAAQLIANG
jgi:hypothetical protein